jgi:aminopeptidase N
LPADHPVWILGRRNRFAAALLDGEAVRAGAGELVVDGTTVPFAAHTTVIVRRHPLNAEKAVGLIVADALDALPGLGRKLPHYGKYSYVAFEGSDPVNVLKGEWKGSDSPLRVDLRAPAARATALPPLALPASPPLVTLPAVSPQ